MEIDYYLLALASDCLKKTAFYLSDFTKSIIWPEVIPDNNYKT